MFCVGIFAEQSSASVSMPIQTLQMDSYECFIEIASVFADVNTNENVDTCIHCYFHCMAVVVLTADAALILNYIFEGHILE